MSNFTAIALCVLALVLAAAALMGLAGVLMAARRNARRVVVVPAAQFDSLASQAPAARASRGGAIRTRDLQE